MAVEKRDGVWINTEVPGQEFTSRDLARQAKKINDQESAMATYEENLSATEALDGAEDTEAVELTEAAGEEFPGAESFTGGFERELSELATVERETVKQVRARENVVYMALYANTEPARAYWRKLAEIRGYEVPAE
jgi:hypothetical protein